MFNYEDRVLVVGGINIGAIGVVVMDSADLYGFHESCKVPVRSLGTEFKYTYISSNNVVKGYSQTIKFQPRNIVKLPKVDEKEEDKALEVL